MQKKNMETQNESVQTPPMVMSEVSSSHHLSDEPLRCFEGKENADVAKVVGKRKRQKRDSPQCCFTNNLDNGSAVVGDGVTDDSGAKNGSVLVVSNENIDKTAATAANAGTTASTEENLQTCCTKDRISDCSEDLTGSKPKRQEMLVKSGSDFSKGFGTDRRKWAGHGKKLKIVGDTSHVKVNDCYQGPQPQPFHQKRPKRVKNWEKSKFFLCHSSETGLTTKAQSLHGTSVDWATASTNKTFLVLPPPTASKVPELAAHCDDDQNLADVMDGYMKKFQSQPPKHLQKPLNFQNEKVTEQQKETTFSLGPPVLVDEPSPKTEVVKKVASRKKGKRPPLRKTTPGRFTKNPLVIKEEIPPPPPQPQPQPQGIEGGGEITIGFDSDISVAQMVNKLVEEHMRKGNLK